MNSHIKMATTHHQTEEEHEHECNCDCSPPKMETVGDLPTEMRDQFLKVEGVTLDMPLEEADILIRESVREAWAKVNDEDKKASINYFFGFDLGSGQNQ